MIKQYFESIQSMVKAERVGNKLWIHFSGRTQCIDLEMESSKGRRRQKDSKATSNSVLAPMPGKITKVFVALGQAVKAGDPVIMMEAMKMEYTLKAPIGGLIKKLQKKESDQVNLGELLIEVEPTQAKSE